MFFQLHRGDNLAELSIIATQIFYAFGVVFVVSELGQRINLAFKEIGEIISEFDWYLFPAKIQRMLPFIINYAQQSVDITCFGSAVCDRDTFKSVSAIESNEQIQNNFHSIQFNSHSKK